MLSLFPQILFLAPFAATLIRITLTIMMAYEGWQLIKKSQLSTRLWGFGTFAVAVALFLGAWTQLAALIGVLAFITSIFAPQFRTLPRSTYVLMAVMVLTLVVTGAGAFAFDLPL